MKQDISTRYMFSLSASIEASRLGETPAGYRVDIEYTSGKVTTDPSLYKASWINLLPTDNDPDNPGDPRSLEGPAFGRWLTNYRRKRVRPLDGTYANSFDWYGLEGELISGSDWLLVRSDGVAEINSRITLQEEKWGTDLGGSLINAELATVADLWKKVPNQPRPKGSQVYEDWKQLRKSADLHFSLAIRFRLAEASQPWAGSEFRSNSSFWRYESLPRYQYAANAHAKVTRGLIEHIRFDVWRIEVENEPSTAAER